MVLVSTLILMYVFSLFILSFSPSPLSLFSYPLYKFYLTYHPFDRLISKHSNASTTFHLHETFLTVCVIFLYSLFFVLSLLLHFLTVSSANTRFTQNPHNRRKTEANLLYHCDTNICNKNNMINKFNILLFAN